MSPTISIDNYIGRSWLQLSDEEKYNLAVLFGTSLGEDVERPFTSEQISFLSVLYLDVTGKESLIESLIDSNGVVLKPIKTKDNRSVIRADVLTNPKSYSRYLLITINSPLLMLTLDDFPSNIPVVFS